MHLTDLNWSTAKAWISVEAEGLSVCLSGAFRCVGTQSHQQWSQRGYFYCLSTWDRLLGHLKFSTLQWERLFTNGKRFRELSIIPRGNCPACCCAILTKQKLKGLHGEYLILKNGHHVINQTLFICWITKDGVSSHCQA